MEKLKSKECTGMMELHSQEFTSTNAEKEILNSMKNFGLPTTKMANVCLKELSEYFHVMANLEIRFNDKQV